MAFTTQVLPGYHHRIMPSDHRSHPMRHPNPLLTGDRLFLSCYWLLFLVIKMVPSLVSTVSVNLKDRPTPFETQASPPPPPVTCPNVLVPARVLRGTCEEKASSSFLSPLCFSTLSCGLRTQA